MLLGGIALEEIVVKGEERTRITRDEDRVHHLNARSKEHSFSSPKEALRLAQEAYKLSLELDYKRGIAESLLMTGYACRTLSNYVESMAGLMEALDIYRDLEEFEGQMRVLNLMGISYFYLSRYEIALENFKKSLGFAERLQNKNLEASILNNIGEIYRELGKPKDSIEYYFNALKISEGLGIKQNVSVISMNIGHIHNDAGEYDKALEYYDKSLKVSREINDHISMGEVLTKIGQLYERLNEREKALGFYEESMGVLEECGNRFYQIDVLISLGSYYIKQKEFDKGSVYLNRALDYAEDLNAYKKVYSAHMLLAECCESCGDFAEALYHHKRFHEIEKKVITDNLEERLKVITVEYKLDKLQKESEIYRLKNIELKQVNEMLNDEITARIELQEHLEQANKKLEHLSYIDELTNIPNRRIFNEVIKKQWSHCSREAIPLSVILLDIDYFKNYNDNYGHLAGDECLRKVAQTLAESMKCSYDFIARFGGEEFGIILPGTGFESSIMLAEQMRISVESLRLKHEFSCISPYITISLGVATVLPEKHMSCHELINASDKQLYKAKQEGRNRVCAVHL